MCKKPNASEDVTMANLTPYFELVPKSIPLCKNSSQMAGKIADNKTVRKDETTGRNDDCPCGSGKKYKKCCGR